MTATISDSSSRAHGRGKPSARSGGERTAGEICDVVARPQPGQGDRPATAVPFLDVPAALRVRVLAAFLLGVIARDRLGDPGAAGCALQRALDLAEPDRVPCPFLIHPPTRLPDRQVRRRSTDAALISETSELAARADRLAPPPGQQAHHFEALSHSEIRVLRYLPTNLSAREIAGELYVSVNTVKTHQRHLYQKLGARSRTQAVEQARALGLLAPSVSPKTAREFQLSRPQARVRRRRNSRTTSLTSTV